MIKEIAGFKRIFIFDPCFGEMTGHWENYCKRLYFELVKREYEVKVFGQASFTKKITEGVVFSPVFHHTPYTNVDHDCEFNKQKRMFLDDLKEIDETEFVDGDLLIFHSIFPQVFAAIVDWTTELVKRKKVVVSLFLQFPAAECKKHLSTLKRIYYRLKHDKNISPSMEWVETPSVKHYRKYAEALREPLQNGSHFLMASTDVLARNFSLLLDLPVHELPMPGVNLTEAQRAQPAMTKNDKAGFPQITIGYFGHSSLEKGGHFLRFLVEKLMILYQNVKFILHINPNPATKVHLKCFENNKNPNIECHYGHLDPEVMLKLISRVDIILLPYSPVKYGTTPSAILTEGLPFGKIFIIPKNTWAYTEALKYDVGFVAFERYTRKSILKALIVAIYDFRKLQARSAAMATKFYNDNNITNYTDVFMDILTTKKQQHGEVCKL